MQNKNEKLHIFLNKMFNVLYNAIETCMHYLKKILDTSIKKDFLKKI